MSKALAFSLFLIGCATASTAPAQTADSIVIKNTGSLKRVGPYAWLTLGDIDRDSVMKLIMGIQESEKQGLPVLLEINSGGGMSGAGFLLSKVLENSEVKIRCLVDGAAASMALEILWACDERVATPRSVFMFHQPKTSLEDKKFTPEDLLNEFEEISVFWRTLCLDAAYHTKLKYSTCMERTSGGKELYLDAQQALDYGLISEIVAPIKPLKPSP